MNLAPKIAVLGVSVEGMVTVRYLLKKGYKVTVFDAKTRDELGHSYKLLKRLGASFSLGKNHLQRLSDFQTIFRSPGVPLWLPELRRLQKRGAYITSQTRFFFEHAPCRIIGVTGTKGKGTTSALIAKMLTQAGFHAELGGNIGRPPLSFIAKLKPDSLAVIELSSFQLQDLHLSPHIAVVLMVTKEHLASSSRESPNYHKTIAEYVTSKSKIVCFQKKNDIAIFNADYPNSRYLAHQTIAKTFFYSVRKKVQGAFLKDTKIYISKGGQQYLLGDTSTAKLLGKHNRENMMAAALACLSLGVPRKVIQDVILAFPGLEHRLEIVGQDDGIVYVNDSFSTTPETAIAALRSFSTPLIWIAGGSEKGSDYGELGRVASLTPVKAAILIGQMKFRLRDALIDGGFRGQIIIGDMAMKEIIKKAKRLTQPGDTILFSPACASYDMFRNYKERGKKFKDAIKSS